MTTTAQSTKVTGKCHLPRQSPHTGRQEKNSFYWVQSSAKVLILHLSIKYQFFPSSIKLKMDCGKEFQTKAYGGTTVEMSSKID